MPRENSFTDSVGRSLTPDLDEDAQMGGDPHSPVHPPNSAAVDTKAPHKGPTPSLKSTHRSPTARKTTFLTPVDRFRSTVRKVMALHRASSYISSNHGIGAEPGIDPRRQSADLAYGHIKQECSIQIIDYSAVRSSLERMSNRRFAELYNDPAASRRDPWVKVRWINIGGISWDVIKVLALKYDLHPLAIEDVLHQRGRARSKADYYQKHLFLRVLCHSLADEEDIQANVQLPAALPRTRSRTTMTGLPRCASPMTMGELDMYDGDENGVLDLDGANKEVDEDATAYGGSQPLSRFGSMRFKGSILKRRPFLRTGKDDIENARERLQKLEKQARHNDMERDVVTIEQLKKGERVNVKLSPMFIFLLRNGTVISIHPTPNLEFTSPITARIKSHDTGLRTSADASLLVQSLLDLIVDQTLEVVDEYHAKILKLEHDILLKPKMKTNRYLHILSGDLIMHKRTLEPIKTLIYGLRRYDVDRCAALVDLSTAPPGTKIEGFMSHKAKIYLADVFDHMEYILSSLDMFAGISENLINYTFNIASYEMNEIMRQLTTVTIIFLPLTLLTGYFGMNFENMWSIHHNHSDIYFWLIALPMMSIVIPLFLRQDIERVVHYIQKRILAKNAVKSLKQA